MQSKIVETNKYIIIHDPRTGLEICQGKNCPDPEVLDVPALLDIGIMGHCKNKCSFCYQGDLHQEHMQPKEFMRIIDQCKDHVTQVALGGRGDPNQHPFFWHYLAYCRENRVVPNYTTSGIDLTKLQVDSTKEICGSVAVSMYNKGHTFDALKRFMDVGMKTNIHYIITSRSVRHAIDLINGIDIWNGMVDLNKLNAIVFLLFKPFGKGEGQSHLIPSSGQLSKLFEANRNIKCNFKIGMDSCLVNKISDSRELTVMEKLCADSCEAARFSCYIGPDSKMIPCSFLNKNKGETITDEMTIEKIWKEGSEFKSFRKLLLNNPTQCPIGG